MSMSRKELEMEILIDGIEYDVKFDYYNRALIKNNEDGEWYLLKVHAIAVASRNTYLMPVKSFFRYDGKAPNFLAVMPNAIGGNVESNHFEMSSIPLINALEQELKEEMHGQCESKSYSFLSIFFQEDKGRKKRSPKGICYVFFSADVTYAGKRVALDLSEEMKEMTGDVLMFSNQDILREIRLMNLGENLSTKRIKEAILSIHKSKSYMLSIKSKVEEAIEIGSLKLDYQNELEKSEGDFLEQSHTIEAVAEFVQSRVEKYLRQESERKRQKEFEEFEENQRRLHTFMINLMVIVCCLLIFGRYRSMSSF
jgi:hypothetical protein